jgi:coenzyme F420-reducing hydrogenase delta subunit
VAWVRNLLDEIGLGGRRLYLSNISAGDNVAASQIIQNVLKDLADLGPNPAV